MFDEFWTYVLVGFAAQLVDGSIGMAFGVASTSMLLTAGVTPASASAAVHAAKIFTGVASGLSHYWLGNIDWPLCRKLLIPGCAGGVLGATMVSNVPAEFVKPVVAVYLSLMGAILLAKAIRFRPMPPPAGHTQALGFLGGLLDSLGGGWGPVVTSTLIARGHSPRYVIGSANLAEIFVALAQSVAFGAFLGLAYLDVVLGLAIGGVVAAPIAATTTRYIPTRPLILLVGLVIMGLSLRTLAGLWP